VIEFPVFVAHRRWLGSRIVEEGVARRLLALTLQVVALVNAIQRCLDDALVLAGLDLLLEPVAPGPASDVNERRHPVQGREYLLQDCAWLDVFRPTNNTGSPHTAFPSREFSTSEGCHATVRVGYVLGAVVGGEDDDGVVQLAHVLELLENVADVVVQLLHAGFVDTPVLAARL